LITNDYNITMDLDKPVLLQRKTFVQNDTKSCKVVIAFKRNAQAVDLTGLTVNFAFQRADGVSINAMGTITDAQSGACEYVLASNILAVEGQVLMQVSLFGPENERLTSVIQVPFTVIADITDGANPIADADDYPVLTQLISDCTAFLGTEATRQANETTRLANEASREANEVTRQANEDTRLANEITRQDNESIRVSAEGIRQEGYTKMIQDSYVIPKTPVANFAAIASTYPAPENGWTTRCIDNGYMYRYNSTAAAWQHIDTITTTAYDNLLNAVMTAQRTPNITNNESIVAVGKGKSDAGADLDYASSITNGQLTAKLGGRSLFNYANNGVDYANWTVYGTGSTKSASGIHLVELDGSESATLPVNLKPSTQYTLVYKVTGYDVSGTNKLFMSATSAFGSAVLSNVLGMNRVVLTTQSTISSNQIRFVIDNNETDGKYVNFEFYALIEGDYTTGANASIEINNMAYGLKSTFYGGGRIRSVGKNILSINSLSASGLIASSWYNPATKQVAGSISASFPVKVIKGQNYILSATVTKGEIQVLDATGSIVLTNALTYKTPTTDVLYLRMKSDSSGAIEISNVMLEMGTTRTAYEPYKQNEAFIALDEPLRSVPNGTKDEISVGDSGWSLTRNNKGRVLQSVDVADVVTVTNVTYARISKPSDYKYYNAFDGDNEKAFYLSDYNTATYPFDVESNIGKITSEAHTLYFYAIFAKGTTLEQARTALAGKSLIYQLAQPVTTDLPDIPPISIYPRGTIYLEPYFKRMLEYATAGGGLSWTTPVSAIDKITAMEGGEYVEIPSTRYTLAADAKSVKIYTDATKTVEVADATLFVIYAPIKTDESTIPQLTGTYAINQASSIGDINAKAIENTKDIMTLQDQVAMLIVLNS